MPQRVGANIGRHQKKTAGPHITRAGRARPLGDQVGRMRAQPWRRTGPVLEGSANGAAIRNCG
jgi:hypothetical protein